MTTHTFRNGLLLIMAVFLAAPLVSQTGTLRGKVFDANDKLPLIGANIVLKDATAIGTTTDLDGNFVLPDVDLGDQILLVSYVSYATKEVSVNVVEGENEKLDIELFPAAIIGAEVIISAQALGQAKAINKQLNSDAIGNFISVEKIKELPDINAAEAISRLPGVAISRSGGEGNKIIVRGLDPKFTAISVNGVRLPSTSGADRSVDLSVISPQLLSGIELFKSPTPDMDGDALGGSVNLNILRAPEQRKLSFRGLGGANFLANTFNDYQASVSFSQRFFKNKLGVIATANTERFNRASEKIEVGWTDNLKNVIDTANNIFEQQGTKLEYTKGKESRRRSNGTVGLDFGIGENTTFNILGLASRQENTTYDHSEDYNQDGNRVTFNPNIRNSQIDLYSLSLTARHSSKFLTIDWGASQSRVQGQTPLNYTSTFANDNAPFDPEVFTESNRKQPFNFYNFLDLDQTANYLLSTSSSESSNSETITTGFVNFDFNIYKKKNTSINFKVGGKLINTIKDRTYSEDRARLYYLLNNDRFSPFMEEGIGALGVDPSGEFYYSMSNFSTGLAQTFTNENGEVVTLSDEFDVDRLQQFSEIFEGDRSKYFYNDVRNYDLEENVSAGYAMIKAKISDKLTLIPGFRYEYSDNMYNGIYADLNGDFGESGSLMDETADVQYGVLLPHLHIKYKPLKWFDLRASYSTTLARPNYNFLVPSTLVNRRAALRVTQGNPNLKPTISTNYDLFATAYSSKFGLISAGVFYKDIQDAFYPFTIGLNSDSLVAAYGFPEDGFGNARLTTYSSSPESSVTGLEVELQSNLNFLPSPLDGFVLTLNYARLFSSTEINQFREESVTTGTFPFFMTQVFVIPFQREVDLVGQARHIFNASLGYDIKGLSLRASARYQGSRITGYSSSADKDRFSNQFWRIDAVVKYKFTKNFNVFLNLNNLGDQKDINFFRSENFVTQRERFGSGATIGIEYIIR